jgi:8-oxo-dGTP pyrophosphatase MutT (NUDIX family)
MSFVYTFCYTFPISMDKKDILEFRIKRENEERRDGGCAVVFDPVSQKYAVGKHDDNSFYRLFSGGVDDSEDIKDGVLREVVEESGLHDFLYVEKIAEALAHYYNSLRNVNRVGYAVCFLVILKSTKLKPTQLEEHEKFSLAWVSAEEILKDWESRNENKDRDHWIYFLKKSVNRAIELGYDKVSNIKS